MRGSARAGGVSTAVRSRGGSDGTLRVGAWIAVALSVALLAIAFLTTPQVIVIVAPALVGGLAVIGWPHSRPALVVGALLIGATALYLLMGGIGWLYVPSLALIVRGILRPQPTVRL